MKRALLAVVAFIVVGCSDLVDSDNVVIEYEYQYSLINETSESKLVWFSSGYVVGQVELEPNSVWVVGSNNGVALVKVGDSCFDWYKHESDSVIIFE
jgi:hypothetical protein